jgi:hypothetical protein
MNAFLRVVDALNRENVPYVVVGGFAALLHGNNRFTADLDLVVDLQPENARRAIHALTALGLKSRLPVDPLLFADAAVRARWRREKNMMVFSLHDPAAPMLVVDLFVDPPRSFDRLRLHSVVITADHTPVRVCSIDDLIEMKSQTDRPQDALDVQNLRVIRSRHTGGSP